MADNPTDYPETKCDMEVATKLGSVSDLGMLSPNAIECWKQLKTQKIKYQKVTKGDVIDLRKFLFTDYRDYLIRYNDKTQVCLAMNQDFIHMGDTLIKKIS